MKKWLYLLGILAAVGLLSRLPHPARDISELKPVRVVWIYMEDGLLHMETDTGDHGVGTALMEAAESMKANTSAEIYLDTAQYLILHPDVPVAEEFFALLRPTCRVCHSTAKPDLTAAGEFLDIHTPKTTLAHLRAGLSSA